MITSNANLATSKATFKTYLATQKANGYPFMLLYQLKNPTYTNISLPKVATVKGTTNIETTDGTIKTSKMEIIK
ncbi:MAG: hypothetical protein RR847_01615 [Bacilli bacterium]